jgi:5'-3' exonuclease (including N-terminal domain of PolI)
MQRKKLFIVDGNSYCYRAYYAIMNLNTADGRPTGAVYGFVTMLNKLRAEAAPDYLAVCFDLKGPTLRHEKYAEYKINRKPMPDDLREQMKTIKEVVDAYGIPIFELTGYEADDIIATLATRFKTAVDVYVVSNDKDMLQLVDKYVKIYNPQKDNAIVDEKKVLLRYNVNPSQITDLLALTGDSSDNIPGVPGIGEKTAAELIQTFGDLETILKNTAGIPQKKRRELLEQYADQARLSKDLATVVTDVPLTVTLESLAGKDENIPELKKIFQSLEFKSLYITLLQKQGAAAAAAIPSVTGVEHAERLADAAVRAGELSLSVQADERDPRVLRAIDLCCDGETAVRFERDRALSDRGIIDCLDALLRNPKVVKIGYDLKSACVMLAPIGVCLEEPFFDCMLAAYLLEPGAGAPSLADIAAVYAGRSINDESAAGEQSALKQALQARLESKNLADLFSSVEMPLIRVLASMEQAGISCRPFIAESAGTGVRCEINRIDGTDLCGKRFSV